MSHRILVALTILIGFLMVEIANAQSTPLSPPSPTSPNFDQTLIDSELYKHQRVGKKYMIMGKKYTPRHDPNYDVKGLASWYGDKFHGKPTATGEIFDKNQLTAAHRTLPLNSMLHITNLENGKTLMVRLNDRGPFVGDRIIDLSEAAAIELGTKGEGFGKVRVQYAGPADPIANNGLSVPSLIGPSSTDVMVVNFRNSNSAESRKLDSLLSSALSISGVNAVEVVIDTTTQAKWEKSAHQAYDQDIVAVFNKWVGLSGFAAIVDTKSKRVIGCINSTFDPNEIANEIRKMASRAQGSAYKTDISYKYKTNEKYRHIVYTSTNSKTTRCPAAHNPI